MDMVQAEALPVERGLDDSDPSHMVFLDAGTADADADAGGGGDSSTAAADVSRSAVAASASALQLRRRASRRRRDPFTPVLNMHAPHSRLPGRGRRSRGVSLLLGASGSSRSALNNSLSSDDGAARLPYSYTAYRSSRYSVKGAEATPTTGAQQSALGSVAGEEWLIDSASQLANWAAGVEEEQDHRRQVRPFSVTSNPFAFATCHGSAVSRALANRPNSQ